MKMDRQQNWRDDRMSDGRSFGSNYNPCSQSRKISIGLTVDSFFKSRAQSVEKDVESVPTAENLASNKDNFLEKEVMTPTIGKPIEKYEEETSPWVSTRSFHQNSPSPGGVNNSKQASILPATSKKLSKSNGKGTPATHSVQFFANRMSILQSGDVKQKKIDSVIYRRKGWRDVTAARVEEFSFATAQEVLVPEKEVREDKTGKEENTGSETLRMKLQEILGAVSSPNKQFSISQNPEIGANNLKPQWRNDEKGNPVVKGKENDTIESDSESPNHSTRRPLTRSLPQKKPPPKSQTKKITNVAPSSHKEKNLNKNIFSFQEGTSGRIGGGSCTTGGGSSLSKKKKSERKSSTIEPRKMWFHEQNNADETPQATERSKTKNSAEKSSSHGFKIGSFKSFFPMTYSELVEPKNGIQEKDSNPSPINEMKDQLGDGPPSPKTLDHEEEFVTPSFKNIVDPQYNLQSPAFEQQTPNKSSSPCSPPKSNQGELDDHSPEERVFHMDGIRSLKFFLNSTPDYYKSNTQMESSDDAGEPEDSPFVNVKSVNIMKEDCTENRPSKSSSEESLSQSSEDRSPIAGHRETESLFPDVGTAEKPKFVLHQVKRHRSQVDIEVTRSKTTSGAEEKFSLQGLSELNHEDGLTSAVALFALGLERVKSKINSMTRKKTAEVLMSVAEEIHLQLQNAESQIQTDVGKLTSVGKSKRKRLESKFQEQQEQLKVIHERFKEEVSQHLQDCRSTLEGLEAHQIEFKGALEKQKASHRKLLLQAEEAVETQLNDAQRKITTVHKLAKEKMFELKYALSECLKEGILS